MADLKIGMIGLDTSHAVAFTKLLNEPDNEHAVKGGKVEIAFPGGSPDFELSASRVEGYTNELRDTYGVTMTETIEEVAEKSDAILLESVDGAQHLEQLRSIIKYKKPVFIDKPFALSSKEANEMVALSEEYGTPIMSTSALRYSEGLQAVLKDTSKGKIIGADCYGPMKIEDAQPGLFWYGIHPVEMLYAILGEGSETVTTITNEDYDLVSGVWKDGRIGTVRGNRKGNNLFGAVIHFENGTSYVDVSADSTPFYATTLKEVVDFFKDGVSRVPVNETKELVRFIESANESRETGKTVSL